MSLSEYTVVDDFFQCGEIENELDFPCCVCRFKETPSRVPCKICGHNPDSVNFHTCVLCEKIIIADNPKRSSYIAKNTNAQLGPVCFDCFKDLSADIKSR